MAKTKNLGLNLTEDENTSFADWRKSIDGNGSTDETKSNMQIIDEKFGEIGDIGEITIEQTQLLSETQIQLTQAQVDILKAFNFVYIKIPFASIEQLIIKYIQGEESAMFVSPTYINGDLQATSQTYNVLFSNNTVILDGNKYTPRIVANTNTNINGTVELENLLVDSTVYTIPKGLPTVTASDSGKFLTVNASGKWEATAIPSAEDTSF